MGLRTEARNFCCGQALILPRRRRTVSLMETGRHRIPFKEHFKILGFTLNRQGKKQDCKKRSGGEM